jgi:hypothetical protein
LAIEFVMEEIMKTQALSTFPSLLLVLACLLAACAAPATSAPTLNPTVPLPTPTATEIPMLVPGDTIGQMVISNTPTEQEAPPIWAFCSSRFNDMPGTRMINCNIPPLTDLSIGHGWFASDETTREENWQAMEWGLELDDQVIDLESFGAVDVDLPQKGLPGHDPDEEVVTKLRTWVVNVSNLQPGKHTLESNLVINQPVDDGFHSSEPGTYKLVVRFNVAAPPTPTPTFTPPKATLAPGESIAISPEEIAGIWKIYYTPGGGMAYIQFNQDGSWMIAKTLEELASDPPKFLLKGTYRFEGDQFIYTDAQCGLKREGVYQFRITWENDKPSSVSFPLIHDECSERARDFRNGGFWVEP